MRRTALVSGFALVLGFGLSGIGTATAEEPPRAIHPPMPVPVMPVPEEYRPTGPAPGPMVPAAPSLPVPFAPSPGPADGFEGLGDDICSTLAGGCTIPPDTHGAVGLDHLGRVRFMEVLNTEVHIQDDTGGVVWGPFTIDDFWGVGVNPDLDGAFDPRVHYDPLAGRWISVVCDDARTATSAVLVGASQGANPAAAWYKTRIDVDPGNLVWADYPNVGFNSKWVVVQVNLFTVAGNSFDSSQIWVFDKTQLYAGNFTPAGNFRVSGHSGTQVPAATYDAAEGNLYLLQTVDGNSGGFGFLRLYRITGPAGTPVLEWLNPTPQYCDLAGPVGDCRVLAPSPFRLRSPDSGPRTVELRQLPGAPLPNPYERRPDPEPRLPERDPLGRPHDLPARGGADALVRAVVADRDSTPRSSSAVGWTIHWEAVSSPSRASPSTVSTMCSSATRASREASTPAGATRSGTPSTTRARCGTSTS